MSKLKVNNQELPDAKLHQRISFIKSAIRLGACAFGFFGFFELGFMGLFFAEIVGIGEELVQMRKIYRCEMNSPIYKQILKEVHKGYTFKQCEKTNKIIKLKL